MAISLSTDPHTPSGSIAFRLDLTRQPCDFGRVGAQGWKGAGIDGRNSGRVAAGTPHFHPLERRLPSGVNRIAKPRETTRIEPKRMSLQRWQRVADLFHAANELDVRKRAAFVQQACGDDHPLREEVESLLAAAEQGRSFLAASAMAMAATDLARENRGSLLGEKLGHYEVVSLLGRGGMGDVYCVEDSKLGRKVALKILPAGWAQSSERLKRFEQEAKAVAALNHPNIVTIHSTEEWKGIHFMTMEWVRGQSLAERIPKRGVTLITFLELAIPHRRCGRRRPPAGNRAPRLETSQHHGER